MTPSDKQLLYLALLVLAVLVLAGLIVQFYAYPHPWCGIDHTC